MSTVIISDIAQTLPLPSTATPNTSPREEKWASYQNTGKASTKDGKPVPVDTVNLSYQPRQTITDAKREEVRKEETDKVINSEKSDRSISKVQFVYNPKGELSIRYMDTASRLIYQTPSELMLSLEEAASKSDSSVDTSA